MNDLRFKKLSPNATLPMYATPGSAGFDLVATSKERTPLFIEYGTSLAVEIPDGAVGLIFPRSSVSKYDMVLANSVGVIDSDYRGEIKLRFKYSEGYDAVHYNVGDKVAQLIVMVYPKMNPVTVDELSDTNRGVGGFGSTGA